MDGARAGRVLAAEDWRTLAAATERILPSDDGPGAREAHVIDFLDGQLATREFAPLAPTFRRGARVLDDSAAREHGRPFADLAPADQDDLLVRLAEARLPVPRFPQVDFYRLLHNLTLEGFLSDPRHGGNFEQVGWRSIGFPEPARRRRGDRPCH